LKVLPNVIGIVQAEMSDLKSLPRVVSDIYRLAPDGIDELWNVREVDGRNLTYCETNTSRKIQNAGSTTVRGPLTEIDPIRFHEELGINVVAPVAITQGLLPLLRKRQTKKVVFMVSAMGSSQIASAMVGLTLKDQPKPVTEDYFPLNTYCSEKSALIMQAIIRSIQDMLITQY
jgi:hypothetical protein